MLNSNLWKNIQKQASISIILGLHTEYWTSGPEAFHSIIFLVIMLTAVGHTSSIVFANLHSDNSRRRHKRKMDENFQFIWHSAQNDWKQMGPQKSS